MLVGYDLELIGYVSRILGYRLEWGCMVQVCWVTNHTQVGLWGRGDGVVGRG